MESDPEKKPLKWWQKGRGNIVTDEMAPLYYSKRAIYGFSFFFATMFGAVLLALNVKKSNKKGAWMIVLMGVVYTVIMIFIISRGKGSGDEAFLFNLVGGSLLSIAAWDHYLGKDTEYRVRPIWKPLVVSLLIVATIIGMSVLGAYLQKLGAGQGSEYQQETQTALDAYGQGNYQGSLTEITKVTDANPTFSAGYNLKADDERRLGNFNAAITDFTHALENKTDTVNDRNAYIGRAQSYGELNEYANAIADFQSAIQAPSDPNPSVTNAQLSTAVIELQNCLANNINPCSATE